MAGLAMQHQVDIVIRVVDQATAGLNKMSKNVKKMTFDMRQLSLMFGGMALARYFGGALKSLNKTYNEVFQDQANLYNQTTKVSAAFEFLKFSIFNALMQSDLFIGLIDFLVNAINWISEFINKHEELALTIVTVFGLLALGGNIAMIVGQFALFWASVFGPGGLLASKAAAGMGGEAAKAGTVTGAFSKMMGAMARMVGVGLVINAGFKMVKDFQNPSEVTGKDALFTALQVGLGVGLITMNPGIGLIAFMTVYVAYQLATLTPDKQKPLDPWASGGEKSDEMLKANAGFLNLDKNVNAAGASLDNFLINMGLKENKIANILAPMDVAARAVSDFNLYLSESPTAIGTAATEMKPLNTELEDASNYTATMKADWQEIVELQRSSLTIINELNTSVE